MEVVSLFGKPVFFLVLLQIGPVDTFLVASRKHRPHLSSLQAPLVPARASFSKGVVIVYLAILYFDAQVLYIKCCVDLSI